MDAVEFKGRTKHGRLDFHPDVIYGFEDADAAPFFIAAGWAEASSKKPQVVISIGELDIDPATVFADGPKKGQPIIEGAA